jgi:hypothetical protein
MCILPGQLASKRLEWWKMMYMVDYCESYSPFHVCLTIRLSSHLVYATSHLSCCILFIFGILVGHDLSMHILYRFHGWLIFARVIAVFMLCDKRQMTSCIHKMCGWTYGQTNMKRATTLANINHPWNRYNMPMLRSWPIKIPNINKMRQKTND